MARGKGGQHTPEFERKRQRRIIEGKLRLLSLVVKQGKRIGNEIYTTGVGKFKYLYGIPHQVVKDFKKMGTTISLGKIKSRKTRRTYSEGLTCYSASYRPLLRKLKSYRVNAEVLENEKHELERRLLQLNKGGSQ